MHESISINTLALPPADLAVHLETVARLGAAGVNPMIGQVDDFGVARAARAIRDTGLSVSMLTHRAAGYGTSAEAKVSRQRLLADIETAARIGARSMLVGTGGRGRLTWAEAADAFVDAVGPCADIAKSAGITLAIETTSHLYADASIVYRLADAITLARMASIGVVIDLFACWVDADIEAAIAEAGSLIQLTQVCDYVYGDRSLPCRAVPGDGVIPIARLIASVLRTGFDGWFDLEIMGPRLRAEGEIAGLIRAADRLGRMIDSARS